MKAKQVTLQLIKDLPLHKVLYILEIDSTDMFDGIFATLVNNYGLPNTIETLQGMRSAFGDRIQTLHEKEIECEIEFEYTETAYERLTKYTPWK